MPDHGLAEEIAEEILYHTGRAMKAGDFEAMSAYFGMPLIMETSEGDALITNFDALHRAFDNLKKYYDANDVRDVVRTIVRAEFLDKETVGSTYVTQLLTSDGIPFRKPFPGFTVIKHIEGAWKIVSNSTAILDAPDHNHALLSGSCTKVPAPKLL